MTAPPPQLSSSSVWDVPQLQPSSRLCASTNHNCEDLVQIWFVKVLILVGTVLLIVGMLLWLKLVYDAIIQSYHGINPLDIAIQGFHDFWETIKEFVRRCSGLCPRRGDDAPLHLHAGENQGTSPFDDYFPRPGTPIPGSPVAGHHRSLLSSMHHTLSDRL